MGEIPKRPIWELMRAQVPPGHQVSQSAVIAMRDAVNEFIRQTTDGAVAVTEARVVRKRGGEQRAGRIRARDVELALRTPSPCAKLVTGLPPTISRVSELLNKVDSELAGIQEMYSEVGILILEDPSSEGDGDDAEYLERLDGEAPSEKREDGRGRIGGFNPPPD